MASEALGKASRVSDAAARYAEFCKSTVTDDFSLRGLRIALDCANGANYQIAPQLFRELGAELLLMGAEPDGLNINANCGSTYLQGLQQLVVQSKADVGIAFDGDGDRVLFVDADGSVVDGDELLYVLAMDRAASGNKPEIVVGTLMSNYGLERALQQQGIGFRRAKVGDRYVHQQLMECGAVLGGEASGHLLVLDRASTGDGIVSALQVMQAIRRSGQTLAQRRSAVVRVPQQTINVRIANGSKPLDSVGVREAAALAEQRLLGRGRLVLRPSGTEPVVRITVEADEQSLLDSVLGSLSAAVQAAA